MKVTLLGLEENSNLNSNMIDPSVQNGNYVSAKGKHGYNDIQNVDASALNKPMLGPQLIL